MPFFGGCRNATAISNALIARLFTVESCPDGGGRGHFTVERWSHLGESGSQAAPDEGPQGLNDPLFEEKVTEIVGLYLDPPVRAVVLCVDE